MAFTLSITDGNTSQEFALGEREILGTSGNSTIQFKSPDLETEHCIFKEKSGVISLHNLANDGITKVESYPLSKGKMYLLNVGDTIEIGKLKVVLKEEVAEKTVPSISIDEASDDTIEIGDKTDPATPLVTEEEDDDVDLSEFAESAEILSEKIEIDDDDEEGEDDDLEYLDEDEMSDEDLEMLRAIQEGRQPTPKNRTNMVLKIFSKINPSEILARRRTEVEVLEPAPLPSPGFIPRTLITVCNISLTYFIIFTLGPLLHIDTFFMTDLAGLLAPILKLIPTEVSRYINVELLLIFYISHVMIELIGSLILGASIGEVLASVRSNDNIFTMRLKAGLRSVIGNITVLLVLPSLPALIGKRTLKEVISFSSLGYTGNKIIKYIALFGVTPLACIIFLASPVALDLENLEGINFENPVKYRKSAPGEGVNIPVLGIQVDSSYKERFDIVPLFKIEDKNVITPSMRFIDIKKGHHVTVSGRKKSFNFLYNLEQIKKYDLAFPIKYPMLNKMGKEKGEVKMSPQLVSEIKRFKNNSLMVNPQNYLEYISKEGPTVTGNIIYRRNIIESFDLNNVTAQYIGKLSNSYIKFLPKKLEPNKTIEYVPINYIKNKSFSFNFKKSAKSLASKVERLITKVNNTETSENMDIFTKVVDTASIQKNPMVIDEITRFYESKLKSENEFIKREFQRSAKSAHKVLTKILGTKDKQIHDKLGKLKNLSEVIL